LFFARLFQVPSGFMPRSLNFSFPGP
jgi:hypothetical protein